MDHIGVVKETVTMMFENLVISFSFIKTCCGNIFIALPSMVKDPASSIVELKINGPKVELGMFLHFRFCNG